jgi:hypothetical protein
MSILTTKGSFKLSFLTNHTKKTEYAGNALCPNRLPVRLPAQEAAETPG